MEPPALGRADPVLGADASPQIRGQAEDGVVDPVVVGLHAGDVDVDVAVGRVAPHPRAAVGGDPGHHARHLLDERRQPVGGKGDVELVGRAEGVDGGGVVLAVGPQVVAAEDHPGHRGEGADAGGEVGRRVGGVGRRHQHERGVAATGERGKARHPADEVDAAGEHELGRVEGAHVAPEVVGGHDRVGDGVEGEEDGHPVGHGGHQPEAGRRHHPQGPLAATEKGREVVAGVVLHQPAQMGHHRPVAEHRLHSQDLGPGVAVAQDPQAAGVGGDRPPDGGPVAAGEVDPIGPSGGVAGAGRGRLDRGQAGARPRRELAGDVVDGADVVEAAQAEHDLPREGDRPSDEPGVPALKGEADAEGAAGGDHGRHLLGRPRKEYDGRGPTEPARPVDAEGGGVAGCGENAVGPQDVDERAARHPPIVAR